MKKIQEANQRLTAQVAFVCKEGKGQGLVEYALILLFVAMVVVLVLPGVAVPLDRVFTAAASAL